MLSDTPRSLHSTWAGHDVRSGNLFDARRVGKASLPQTNVAVPADTDAGRDGSAKSLHASAPLHEYSELFEHSQCLRPLENPGRAAGEDMLEAKPFCHLLLLLALLLEGGILFLGALQCYGGKGLGGGLKCCRNGIVHGVGRSCLPERQMAWQCACRLLASTMRRGSVASSRSLWPNTDNVYSNTISPGSSAVEQTAPAERVSSGAGALETTSAGFRTSFKSPNATCFLRSRLDQSASCLRRTAVA